MADLSTSIAGIRIRSPIGLSSIDSFNFFYPAGPLDKYVEWHKGIIDEGAGFVVVPSMGFPKRPEPKRKWQARIQFVRAEKGDTGYTGHCGSEMGLLDMDEGLPIIEAFKKAFPADVPVIASVAEPTSDPKDYIEDCKQMESAGADIIELNFGCPLSA